jgi:hypothetical protein
MSTFSHHRLLDDRRLHLVSLFQRVYWNLLLFSLRLLRSPYSRLGTGYLMLGHQAWQIGISAYLGTFSDCPIVLYHLQAVRLGSNMLSYRLAGLADFRSCWLWSIISAERILRTALIVFLFIFLFD